MFGYPWNAVKDPLAVPSGAMRNQLQLQALAPGQDSFGQPLTNWVTYLTTMGAIIEVSSRELFQASQLISQVTHRITVRWPGVSLRIEAGQRVVSGADVYLIQAVENVQQRNRVLLLLCLELGGIE